ncbi:MAG: hypothetical protein NXI18_18515 [Alphaproteobacteria bacterium]|nr:hypothetical protein [Alphaproteobacteria bacterium]
MTWRARTNLPPLSAAAVLYTVPELAGLSRVYEALGYGAPVARRPRLKANGEATIRVIWRDRRSGRSICHTATVPAGVLAAHA